LQDPGAHCFGTAVGGCGAVCCNWLLLLLLQQQATRKEKGELKQSFNSFKRFLVELFHSLK
jgi:hypothetical protein